MERFEINEESNLEIFNNFVSKTKDAFSILTDNIKNNIKKYEQSIEDTEKEIADTETSREKCEHEISKMEEKIDTIKEAIDNVENTYKKMVDAYSSTSKGETKDIYSDIIDGARANCEKDVEKNRSEIARLNSDIEAIKNNIAEFTRIIDKLKREMEGYNSELSKYREARDYLETTQDKISSDLDKISDERIGNKIENNKKETKVKEEVSKPKSEKKEKRELLDALDSITFDIPHEEEKNEQKEVVQEETVSEKPVDDSLQRIYDLTGYKPKSEEKKEEVVEKPKKEDSTYSDNLEALFANSSMEDIKPEVKEEENTFMGTDLSEWEKILNGGSSEPKSIKPDAKDTVNQLLKPYGTDYDKLTKIVGKEIKHKDGSSIPFEMNEEDVINAINSIDGTDLKEMKTVGPEITLLRKVKKAKEGNR